MGGYRITNPDRELICRRVLIDGWSKNRARSLHPQSCLYDGVQYGWEQVDRACKWFESLRPEDAARVFQDQGLRRLYERTNNVSLDSLLPIEEEHRLTISRFLGEHSRLVKGDSFEVVESEVQGLLQRQEVETWLAGRLPEPDFRSSHTTVIPWTYPDWVSLSWDDLVRSSDAIYAIVEEHYPRYPGKFDAWQSARSRLRQAIHAVRSNQSTEPANQGLSDSEIRRTYEAAKKEFFEYLSELAKNGVTGECGMPGCREN